MKYYITEHATYEVEAANPRLALKEFMERLTGPFATTIHEREVTDEQGTDWTKEAQDE
jgi:hypothetical protein